MVTVFFLIRKHCAGAEDLHPHRPERAAAPGGADDALKDLNHSTRQPLRRIFLEFFRVFFQVFLEFFWSFFEFLFEFLFRVFI